MSIEAWFDGACEPRNPGGHASWGALVKVDGVEVYAEGGYVGVGDKMSNNVAEYRGFIAALTEAVKYVGNIHIYGDSKLVIMQVQRKWKAKGGLYFPHYQEALYLYMINKPRVKMSWIPRAQNSACDALSKGVLHARNVVFKLQPEPKDRLMAAAAPEMYESLTECLSFLEEVGQGQSLWNPEEIRARASAALKKARGEE